MRDLKAQGSMKPIAESDSSSDDGDSDESKEHEDENGKYKLSRCKSKEEVEAAMRRHQAEQRAQTIHPGDGPKGQAVSDSDAESADGNAQPVGPGKEERHDSDPSPEPSGRTGEEKEETQGGSSPASRRSPSPEPTYKAECKACKRVQEDTLKKLGHFCTECFRQWKLTPIKQAI